MAITELAKLSSPDLKVRLRIDHLPVAEIDRMRASGAIIADPARQRPRYFDGRFLAATDLERDQGYFLGRVSELARAAGAGVISGLLVAASDDFRLTVSPGIGLTPAGELISVIPPGDEPSLTIDLADVATIQELDGAFGLLDSPREPARNRSGLFVLALRPVSYTANPIGSYPVGIDERRKVQDGEVIEATAIVLLPIQDPGFEARPAQQRSIAARRIFVDSRGAPADASLVPVAVLQLETGIVRWVDPYLVRREIGIEHASVGAFGASSRAVREAYFQQYQAQLTDVLAARAGASLRFAAAEVFRALPPAGPLPAAAVDLTSKTQTWFPSGMPVVHVSIPEDELPVLLEESLLLPPIDLQASPAELARVPVLIVTPVPRAEFTTQSAAEQPLASPAPPPLPGATSVVRLLASGGFPNLRLRMVAGAATTPPAVPTDTTTPPAPPAGGEAGPGGATPALRWYVRRRLRHLHPDAAVIAAENTGA